MMPPNGPKQSFPAEMLSNLPENVIDDILMLLPLRDAVRTSILSKKWRHNWCRLPQLKLDQTLWQTTNDLIFPTTKFTNIVYHLLALHAGPVSQFTLSISDIINCTEIDVLICFLSRNGIQHLVLQLPVGSLYKLPSSFFTCLQLRHLTLQRCIMRPPPDFMGFGKLISLELNHVTISSESLGTLISHCPLLENLELEHSDNPNHVEIDAPKLRSFVFTGSMHFIHLKNVPLLAKVSHESTECSVKAGKHDLVKFFKSIPALEHLQWNYINFRFMVTGPADIPKRLPSALKCLKRLYISKICLDELVELSCALCLLRSSPYLEEIDIEAPGNLPGTILVLVPRFSGDRILDSFSDVTFNHLRVVKIEYVAGSEPQMQLIEGLLAKSPVLVRMVIRIAVVGDRFLKVLEQIIKFPRASPKAEVVYTLKQFADQHPALVLN